MAYDLQEQEQLDALRAFGRRWGLLIAVVVFGALLSVAGYRAWNAWQERQARAAMVVFEQLQQAIKEAKNERIEATSQILLKQFPRTVYASMGAVLAARAYLDANNRQGAKVSLEWVVKSAPDPEYRWLARLQLAGVLLDEKAYTEGLKWVSGEIPAAWRASFADRRGDLLWASGQVEAARKAYLEALGQLDPAAPWRHYVQRKLDALGEV